MTAEVIALFVAGLIAAPFIQFVKERLKLEDWKALWLAWILCILLALGALLITGELYINFAWQDPVQFFTELGVAFSAVFGLATIVYKAKFASPGQQRAPPE